MPTRVIPPRSSRAPNAVWHYLQPGFDEPIQAQSYDELITEIVNFRVLNEIDIGDPEKDVEAYFRNHWPGIQKKSTRELSVETKNREDQRTLMDKVRTWSKLAKNQKFQNVKPTVSGARSSICVNCPKNILAERASLCSPCISSLNRTATILNKNSTVDELLGVCSAVNQDNRVAVFMPKDNLDRSLREIEKTPNACWLRHLE